MNPFKKNTISHNDFEILSDLKWHCTKCELKSGQAKTWQVWRQKRGIQLDTDEKGKFFRKVFCKNCNNDTIHRRLKSLETLYCEKCMKSNIRGIFPGIYYWHNGSEKWECNKSDEKGCIGCFWYDSYTWREKLNNFLKKLKK
jgi:hypothetical protein